MSEFVNFLHEVFESFGPIRSLKMFGGHGIYHKDLMFALVADDQLYLKTDSTIVHLFEDKELEPFIFQTSQKEIKMSYYLAPEEIFDDPDQAYYWADLSFNAALRSNGLKTKESK